jgi:hypothetical protein
MAWTAPRTWVTGETVTAALMNSAIRDNLLETSAATATTAGDLVYADAANSMGSRLGIGSGNGSHLASTGSAPVWRSVGHLIGDASYGAIIETSFDDFANLGNGTGTNVTVTVTTGTRAIVFYGARSVANTTAGAIGQISYRVSGATTTAASVNWGTVFESTAANDAGDAGRMHVATLTAGSNTFTLQGFVSAGSGTIGFPYIAVLPF